MTKEVKEPDFDLVNTRWEQSKTNYIYRLTGYTWDSGNGVHMAHLRQLIPQPPRESRMLTMPLPEFDRTMVRIVE